MTVTSHSGGRSTTADGVDWARDLSSQEVRHFRETLASQGLCQIDNFVPPDILKACVRCITPTTGFAYRKETNPTIYLTSSDTAHRPDHPLHHAERTRVGTLAADQLSPDLPLYSLYRSDRFVDLVSTIVGRKLYRHADPLGSINALVFEHGDELGWHYDEPQFSVTILLQQADAGGRFEYVPPSLIPDKFDYETVRDRLLSHETHSKVSSIMPGTLLFIRGKTVLHRVTRVQGTTSRLIGVLSFSEGPDTILTEYDRILFYGRR